MGAGERSLLIENVMGGDVDEPPSRSAAEIRAAWGIAADAPLALYTGTFEAYQGVDMLIDAAAIVATAASRCARAGGGRRAGAGRSGEGAGCARPARRGVMIFTGQQPAKEIPGFVQAARSAGLAAHSRHQHAAEDLFVPAIGQADRGDEPADAHAGADAGDREAGRAEAGAVCRGDGGADRQPDGARAACGRGARGRARRSTRRESYLRRTAQAYARLGARARRSTGARDCRGSVRRR